MCRHRQSFKIHEVKLDRIKGIQAIPQSGEKTNIPLSGNGRAKTQITNKSSKDKDDLY